MVSLQALQCLCSVTAALRRSIASFSSARIASLTFSHFLTCTWMKAASCIFTAWCAFLPRSCLRTRLPRIILWIRTAARMRIRGEELNRRKSERSIPFGMSNGILTPTPDDAQTFCIRACFAFRSFTDIRAKSSPTAISLGPSSRLGSSEVTDGVVSTGGGGGSQAMSGNRRRISSMRRLRRREFSCTLCLGSSYLDSSHSGCQKKAFMPGPSSLQKYLCHFLAACISVCSISAALASTLAK
mmetsp:Transcript_78153/g.147539  ORF Transcript_78153/g.147539 Transcript_78153/m.147539 type:complete len:242 (+) Transcript_78153:1847-2572(+)